MASTRLPGKPLADVGGRPMIVEVARRSAAADIGRVVVATDDEAVRDAVTAAGFEVVMTRSDHASGSDRIFEALGHVDPEGRATRIVNVQGDLPTIAPETIRASLEPLETAAVDIATLVAEIVRDAERDNPNVVKAILSMRDTARRIGRALYFTRATAPTGAGPLYHHIGLYAYRRDALSRFVGLPPAPLERRERLEQLRALEADMRIDAIVVDAVPLGVDTPEDLARARQMLHPHTPRPETRP